jgi:hypothetical protein
MLIDLGDYGDVAAHLFKLKEDTVQKEENESSGKSEMNLE